MGHPSDWDPLRLELQQRLPDFDMQAIEIQPAATWDAGVKQLHQQIPPGSILVGYSMGARLGLGIAFANPQRLSGLVFVSGNPGLESSTARQQRWQSDQALAQRIERAFHSDSVDSFLHWWYQQAVFQETPWELRSIEIQQKLKYGSREWSAIIRANSVSQQPNYWPDMPELGIPVCFVSGQNDKKYSGFATRFQNQHMRTCDATYIVPDCGHLVHKEKPLVLCQIIEDFVASVNNHDAPRESIP